MGHPKPPPEKACYICGSYGFKRDKKQNRSSWAYCFYHEEYLVVLPWSKAQKKQPLGERYCKEWDHERDRSVKATDVFNKKIKELENGNKD